MTGELHQIHKRTNSIFNLMKKVKNIIQNMDLIYNKWINLKQYLITLILLVLSLSLVKKGNKKMILQ